MAKVEDFFEILAEMNRRLEAMERVGGSGKLALVVYTDATRPSAGIAGRVIFNSDDGQLNIDNGTNWTLPDGTIT